MIGVFKLLGEGGSRVQALPYSRSDSQGAGSLNLLRMPAHVLRVRALAVKLIVCHELPLVVRHETLVVLYSNNKDGLASLFSFQGGFRIITHSNGYLLECTLGTRPWTRWCVVWTRLR